MECRLGRRENGYGPRANRQYLSSLIEFLRSTPTLMLLAW